MSVLNGSSYSRFVVTAGDAPSFTVDLPLANSLVETNEIRKIEHELIGLDISNPSIETAQSILGYFITFTIDFSEWITAETLKNKIELLLTYAKAGRTITLTPRIDLPTRSFDVIFANDSFDLGIGTSGYSNRLPVFTFRTKNLEPSLKWEIVTPVSTSQVIATLTTNMVAI